jgi:hypothetical protein
LDLAEKDYDWIGVVKKRIAEKQKSMISINEMKGSQILKG